MCNVAWTEREKIVRASKSLQQSSPGTRSEKMNPFWVLSSLLLTANAQLYQQKPYMPAPRSYDLQASPAKESNIIKDASNAISDTVTAALSWDPTGVSGSKSGMNQESLKREIKFSHSYPILSVYKNGHSLLTFDMVTTI